MRVLLVGSASNRARMRAELLAPSVEVIEEFPTLEAARASSATLTIDAIVIATDEGQADTFNHELTAPRPPGGVAPLVDPLTPREVQVIELMAEGFSNKAIGIRLGISDQTVKFHVAAISGKLGARNRTDAVRRAVRLGLITL